MNFWGALIGDVTTVLFPVQSIKLISEYPENIIGFTRKLWNDSNKQRDLGNLQGFWIKIDKKNNMFTLVALQKKKCGQHAGHNGIPKNKISDGFIQICECNPIQGQNKACYCIGLFL